MDYFHKRDNPPWPHQLECFKFVQGKPGVGIFFKMGGGKTRMAIDIAYNMRAKTAIVLCPKTVIPTWIQQIGQHWPNDDWPPMIASFDDSIGRSLQAKTDAGAMAYRAAKGDGRPFILLINYEAFWRQPVRQWILAKTWDLAIADECQELSTPGSKQSRAAALLGHLSLKRLGLSGTPLRQGPLNAYGIYRFLDNRIFGTNYAAFKAKYAYCDPMFPSKVWRYLNVEDFNRRFGSIAFQYAGDPPCAELDIERTCRLGEESRRVYEELFSQFVTEVRQGRVTPQNAAVRLLRLQQVTSGFVGTDDGRLAELGTEKGDLLEEVIAELAEDEPLVVWCRFHHDLDVVHKVAEKMKRGSLELSGRVNALQWWANPEQNKDFPILAAQISTGVGINDLVRAKYSIDYSIGYSLLDYDQHRARFTRPGQKAETVYHIHLLTDAKVDRAVYDALAHKRDVVSTFMDLAAKEAGVSVEAWQ